LPARTWDGPSFLFPQDGPTPGPGEGPGSMTLSLDLFEGRTS